MQHPPDARAASSRATAAPDRATTRQRTKGVDLAISEVQILFGLSPDDVRHALLCGQLEQTAPGFVSARSVQAYLRGVAL